MIAGLWEGDGNIYINAAHSIYSWYICFNHETSLSIAEMLLPLIEQTLQLKPGTMYLNVDTTHNIVYLRCTRSADVLQILLQLKDHLVFEYRIVQVAEALRFLYVNVPHTVSYAPVTLAWYAGLVIADGQIKGQATSWLPYVQATSSRNTGYDYNTALTFGQLQPTFVATPYKSGRAVQVNMYYSNAKQAITEVVALVALVIRVNSYISTVAMLAHIIFHFRNLIDLPLWNQNPIVTYSDLDLNMRNIYGLLIYLLLMTRFLYFVAPLSFTQHSIDYTLARPKMYFGKFYIKDSATAQSAYDDIQTIRSLYYSRDHQDPQFWIDLLVLCNRLPRRPFPI